MQTSSGYVIPLVNSVQVTSFYLPTMDPCTLVWNMFASVGNYTLLYKNCIVQKICLEDELNYKLLEESSTFAELQIVEL